MERVWLGWASEMEVNWCSMASRDWSIEAELGLGFWGVESSSEDVEESESDPIAARVSV